MIVLVQATVLAVGLNDEGEVLQELPIQVVTMRSGIEAARSLKNEKIDGVISRWDLADMRNGRFLKGLKAVKPDIPTIALIKAGDPMQEVAARSIGVSAVLTDEAGDDFFRETVANVLKLRDVVSIKAIYSAERRKSY